MTVQSVMDEIREGRVRISRECGHDPARLIAYFRKYNRACAAQVRRYGRTHRPYKTAVKAAG